MNHPPKQAVPITIRAYLVQSVDSMTVHAMGRDYGHCRSSTGYDMGNQSGWYVPTIKEMHEAILEVKQ